ncbi:MAG: S-adenosyl-l-methionine hydroxide adenosyltransferase family protein [Chloroflexi bacterium]|nr:S-adenosyl-l-methionine hydroxide adenosyltransferase family protein [Chloroflexota bacterium]
MPIITLTTDFGLRDGFVGAMKGVILGINPGAQIVDITHEIPPQDIAHAAFVLGATCPYFPRQSVHVAVVDPGVGTARHPLLLVTANAYFIAPDNGILSYILAERGALKSVESARAWERDRLMRALRVSVPEGCAAYVLNRSSYWRSTVSNTFHGRDIFAPVAAHLSAGVPPDSLGQRIGEVVCLDIPQPTQERGAIRGHVIYVDRFGNLVSNIRASDAPHAGASVSIKGNTIQGISASYEGGKGLLAIVGSHGYLELAVRKGSAAELLHAGVGTELMVMTS